MDKGGKPSAKPKTKVKKETNSYDRKTLPTHLQNNKYNDVLIIGADRDRSDVHEFRSTISLIAGTDVAIDVLLLTEKHCQDEDGAIKRSTLVMFYFTKNTTKIYSTISNDVNFRDLFYGQKIIPVYSMRKEELNLPMCAIVAAPLMYYRRDPEFKRAVQTLLKKHQHTRLERQKKHEDEERQIIKEKEQHPPPKTAHRTQPIIYIGKAKNVQVGDKNIVINNNSGSDSEKETFSNEDLFETKQLNIRNGNFVDVSLPFDTQGRRDGNENDERHISIQSRQTLLASNPENNICNEINSNTFASNITYESNIQSKPSQDGFSTPSTSRLNSFSSGQRISSPTSRENVHTNFFTSRSDKSMLNHQSVEGRERPRQESKPTNDSEDIHSNKRGSNFHSESNIPPRDIPHISDSRQPLEKYSSLPVPQPIECNLPMPGCDNNSIPKRDDCEYNTASFLSSSDTNSLPKATSIADLSPFTSLFSSVKPSSTSVSSNVSTPPSFDGESPNISIPERVDTDCENNTASFRSSSDMTSLPKATPIPDLLRFTSLFSSGTPSSTSPLSNVSKPPSLDGDSPNISYGSSLSLPLHQSPSLNDSLMTENHSKKKENHSKK